MNNRAIKIGSAGLAFVPLGILGLNMLGVLDDSKLVTASKMFQYPAIALIYWLTTFHLGPTWMWIFFLSLMILWPLLISVVFWKIAAGFLREDEPEGQPFDWVGFQVRFFCGAVLGALLGWRFWIKFRFYEGTGPGLNLFICMCAGAMIIGLAFGVQWREKFWKRPL